MKISFSSASDWRRCQQLYFYSYVEGLRSLTEEPAPVLGRLLHRYLEHFYRGSAHSTAWQAVEKEFTKECNSMARAAFAADAHDLGRELQDVVPRGKRIAESYFATRGRLDRKLYKPLYVELYVTNELYGGNIAPAIIDLVTKEKATGRVLLWEHKTTGNVPQQGRRLRDLQTLLSAALIEEAMGVHIDGIVWNYLRTKEPTIPEPLQKGGLTRRRDLDTTWPVYAAAVKRNKLSLSDYRDMRERLVGRDLEVFFPRMELPIVQSEQVLLGDLIRTGREIEQAVSDPDFVPVRNISHNCDWCPMRKLCEAVIVGGEGADEELKRSRFKTKGRREEYAPSKV